MDKEFIKGVCGEHTRTKQETFGVFLNYHIRLVRDHMIKEWAKEPYYLYIDPFGGPGYIVNCKYYEGEGSPLKFHQMARLEEISYKMIVAESDPASRDYLTEFLQMEDAPATVLTDARQCVPNNVSKWQYGCVYIDPPMTYESLLLSRELMIKFSKVRPVMDIVFYVQANGCLKRGGRLFKEQLIDLIKPDDNGQKIKEDWIVSRPAGKGQYAFLVGTNYANWAQWKSRGFYNIKSFEGETILLRLNHIEHEQKISVRDFSQMGF